MKLNKIIYLMALTTGLSSCVSDLDEEPINPNLDTPGNVLSTEAAYKQLLAKCYSGLAVSSPSGPSGDPDISGVDGGYGQYLRALYNLNVLPTDEAVMGWNDQTIKDLHGLCWTSSDVFIGAMYSRLFYQISLCNEFIRQANASGYSSQDMKNYIAEARCLRALSYYHAIDMFGNVPFCTEADAIGGTNPKQISRADLFKWLTEEEIPGMMADLPAAGANERYRADKALAKMILAKLYLNAEVYTGTAMYNECAKVCNEIRTYGYQLDSKFSHLFGADNDLALGVGNEIIFSVYQDGKNTQAYGGTTYIVCGAAASTDGATYGISSGWGGMRVTPEFVDLYSDGDERASFVTEGHTKDIADVGEFTNGYGLKKYLNFDRNGNQGQEGAFVDCDFVVFRYADVLLMLSECALHNSSEVSMAEGLEYLNQVYCRANPASAGKTSYTLDDICDERARELAWECHRRSDLIRWGRFTGSEKLWSWKGNAAAGREVESTFSLYPIPSAEIMSNTNLTQNTGY